VLKNCILRSTPASRPNKGVGFNVRPPIRSTVRPRKKFFRFERNLKCRYRGRWVINDGIPCDPIPGQGQGHACLICVKMTDFKVSPLHRYAVIKRLMVNCDSPRRYLNFNRTDFWYSSSFNISRDLQGCFTFGKRIVHLTRNNNLLGADDVKRGLVWVVLASNDNWLNSEHLLWLTSVCVFCHHFWRPTHFSAQWRLLLD